MDGFVPGAMEQGFATTPGIAYTLSFRICEQPKVAAENVLIESTSVMSDTPTVKAPIQVERLDPTKKSSRMANSRFLFRTACVAFALLGGALFAPAATLTASNNVGYYSPILNQLSVPGVGNVACGPCSAVNSFVYLENAYPGVYGTGLVPDLNSNGVIDTSEMIAVSQTLAGPSYMNLDPSSGVLWTNFGPGMQKYIEQKAPGVTSYSSQYLYGSSSSWNFIYQELLSDQDLELLIQMTSPFSGANHYITPYMMSWNDVTASGTLSWVDPFGGVLNSGAIWWDAADQRLDLGAYGTSWIYAGYAEGPVVPEPSSPALLGIGLVGLAGLTLKRSKR